MRFKLEFVFVCVVIVARLTLVGHATFFQRDNEEELRGSVVGADVAVLVLRRAYELELRKRRKERRCFSHLRVPLPRPLGNPITGVLLPVVLLRGSDELVELVILD